MDTVWGFLEWLLANGDPRTQNYVLVRNPLQHIAIVVLYLTFVVKNTGTYRRTPAWVRPAMLIYDLIQVCLSLFVAVELVTCCALTGYSVLCQPLGSSVDLLAVRTADAMWWCYMSKIVDLLDTVFIILNNKTQQVTFLHVYHHSTMVFNVWMAVKFAPDGQNVFSGIVNSTVHVIMYSYYFLSGLGPHMKRYLWWKRYITQIQILQFFAVTAHYLNGCLTKCSFPHWIQYWGAAYCCTLIVLFTNFYLNAYRRQVTKTSTPRKNAINGHAAGMANGSVVSQAAIVENNCINSKKIE